MEDGGSPLWQTLPEMLAARAAAHPDRAALIHLDRGEEAGPPLTYAALYARARSVAAGLQERFNPGDRVMLVFPNEPDFVSALMGCVLAGLVVVPAAIPRNARTMEKLWNLAETAGAVALIASTALRGILGKLTALETPRNAPEMIYADALPAAPMGAWLPPELSADSLAVLQFTSGSTGNQKGVMVSHGNVLHNCRVLESVCGKGQDLRMASWLPFFHDWGLFGCLFLPLFTGGTCAYFDPTDFLRRPRRWPEAISAFGATVACAPTFAYAACTPFAEEPGAPVLDLSRWRLAMIGAEPVRRAVIEGFAAAYAGQGFERRALFPSYGLAEATLMATGGDPAAEPVCLDLDRAELARGRAVDAAPGPQTGSYVGCGKVLLDQDLRIVDPVSLVQCGDRRVGEIWLAGGSVTQGYWRRPEATRDAYCGQLAGAPGQRFLRSGDLGFLVAGEVFICGRLKDVIIKAGGNHLAEDLEHAMERADPALRQGCGAAFSVEAAGSERLVLVQEITYGKRPDLPRLIGAIQRSVSEDHGVMADAILILAPGTLEKTSSGKIRRQATRRLFLDGALEPLQGWQGWT